MVLQMIILGLEKIHDQVTTFESLETRPEQNFGPSLESCIAWSDIVEVFLALHNKLATVKVREVTN